MECYVHVSMVWNAINASERLVQGFAKDVANAVAKGFAKALRKVTSSPSSRTAAA